MTVKSELQELLDERRTERDELPVRAIAVTRRCSVVPNWASFILVAVVALLVAGCGKTSSFGFRLPDGNADAGQAAFADLGCGQCHTIAGSESSTDDARTVVLGGEVKRVRTYGELVTSIINPSHKISGDTLDPALLIDGRSAMESVGLNEVMSVAQLVDLVAYLQPLYEVPTPDYDPYDYTYH